MKQQTCGCVEKKKQVLRHPYCLCYLYLVTKLPKEARKKGFRRRESRRREFRREEFRRME